MCPGAAVSYGELGGRACDEGRDRPCASIGGGGVASVGAAALGFCVTLSRATSRGNCAQDAVMLYRLRMTKSRRLVGT